MSYSNSNLWNINSTAIPEYSAETPEPKTPTFAESINPNFRSIIDDSAKEAGFKLDFAKDLTRALGRPFIENSGYLGNFLAKIPNYINNGIPRAMAYAGQSIWDNPTAKTILGAAYNKYTDAYNSYGNTVDKYIGGDLSANAYDSVSKELLGDYAQPGSQADLKQAAEKMNMVSGIGMGGLTAKALSTLAKFPIKHPKLATGLGLGLGLGLSADDVGKLTPIPKEQYEAFNKQRWANNFLKIYTDPTSREEAKARLIRTVMSFGGSLDNPSDVRKAYIKMSEESKNGN